MKRLFLIEWNKIIHYRAANVFSLIYFGLLISLVFIGVDDISILGNNTSYKELGIFNFPQIWHFIFYATSFLKLFLSIIIVTTIVNEYNYGTIKQNLIDGLSKKEFIASKFLTIVLFSILSTIMVFGITLFLGFSYSESTQIGLVFEEIQFTLEYFLNLVLFLVIIMFLALLIKKTAFAFAGLFIFWSIENVLASIESSFRDGASFYFSDYFPLNMLEKLVTNPISRFDLIKSIGLAQGRETYLADPKTLILSVLYIMLFISMSYLVIKKRDL